MAFCRIVVPFIFWCLLSIIHAVPVGNTHNQHVQKVQVNSERYEVTVMKYSGKPNPTKTVLHDNKIELPKIKAYVNRIENVFPKVKLSTKMGYQGIKIEHYVNGQQNPAHSWDLPICYDTVLEKALIRFIYGEPLSQKGKNDIANINRNCPK